MEDSFEQQLTSRSGQLQRMRRRLNTPPDIRLQHWLLWHDSSRWRRGPQLIRRAAMGLQGLWGLWYDQLLLAGVIQLHGEK